MTAYPREHREHGRFPNPARSAVAPHIQWRPRGDHLPIPDARRSAHTDRPPAVPAVIAVYGLTAATGIYTTTIAVVALVATLSGRKVRRDAALKVLATLLPARRSGDGQSTKQG